MGVCSVQTCDNLLLLPCGKLVVSLTRLEFLLHTYMAFLYVFKFFKVGFKPTGLARHIHFACTDINQLFHTIKGQSSIKKKKKKSWRVKLEIAITCTIPVYLNEEMYTVFLQLPVSNKCPDHLVLWGKSWSNAVKGQGRYEAFLASGFLKMWSFFFLCNLPLHNKGNTPYLPRLCSKICLHVHCCYGDTDK